MPFPFRLMRISGTRANSLVELAGPPHTDELSPQGTTVGESNAAQVVGFALRPPADRSDAEVRRSSARGRGTT
jgi:hypothetical protein